MTGGAERVAHINLPPSFGPLVKAYILVHHYICLQYILFSVCVDFDEIDKLFGISFVENLANNCFGFLSPNEVISYVYKGQSICSVLVNV